MNTKVIILNREIQIKRLEEIKSKIPKDNQPSSNIQRELVDMLTRAWQMINEWDQTITDIRCGITDAIYKLDHL